MSGQLLSDLIKDVEDAIRPFGHSQSTLSQYAFAWRRLCKYFADNKQQMYSTQLAKQYVFETRRKYEVGEILQWRFKLIRQTAALLEQFSEHGYVVRKHASPWGRPDLVVPQFFNASKEYISELERCGKGAGTISLYKTVSDQFLKYLEQAGFKSFTAVTHQTVSDFVPFISKQYQVFSMRTVFSSLRSFLTFAAAAKYTVTDLTGAVPRSFGRKTTIVPTITVEEERRLFTAIDCKTAKGKRDYAIILLALRIGLRSVDIANLQFENIKWRTNTLEIIQQKTGRMLILPLLPDVGNAIIDYILHGRPATKGAYVFIRSQAPYTRLSENLYGIVNKYMVTAGIRQNYGDRRGLHCFRHSTAARLLAVETPLPIISTILGHGDKDSTTVYLSTDLEHLRACALGLKGIEVAVGELQ